MGSGDELGRLLQRIDGQSFGAYKQIKGRWGLGAIEVRIDHVQGDPFAAPSRLRVRRRVDLSAFQRFEPDVALAVEDYLLRQVGQAMGGTRRGSGKSGLLSVYRPGPEVVERSSLRWIDDDEVEVRLSAGLPARGRRILGQEAWAMLTEDLPGALQALERLDGLAEHVRSVCRQRAMRRELAAKGWVAFIEDGAVLPRASGVDARPLQGAVPWVSPPGLRATLKTPFGEAVGTAIPEGVTVITGGGFHGKSTVLQALELGHLDRIPGDGREGVVSRPSGSKIRAEDGRRVDGVNISAFLSELPGGRQTTRFTTDDASGSTSQAAAIVEAVEAGAQVLWIDEDTSATNLLVRDARMAKLIPSDQEPITPFVSRVRALYAEWGVSTVMVVGGIGDYLGAADTVIAMADWSAREITAQAKALVPPPEPAKGPLERPEGRVFQQGTLRWVDRVRAASRRTVSLEKQEIDLTGVACVLDGAHARSLGLALRLMGLEGWFDGTTPLDRLLDRLEVRLGEEGVEALTPFAHPEGDLIYPRRQEVAAALSRCRQLAPQAPGPRPEPGERPLPYGRSGGRDRRSRRR